MAICHDNDMLVISRFNCIRTDQIILTFTGDSVGIQQSLVLFHTELQLGSPASSRCQFFRELTPKNELYHDHPKNNQSMAHFSNCCLKLQSPTTSLDAYLIISSVELLNSFLGNTHPGLELTGSGSMLFKYMSSNHQR